MEIGAPNKTQAIIRTSLKRKIISSTVVIPCIKAVGKKKKKQKENMSVYVNSLNPTTNTVPPNTRWKIHFKGEVSNANLEDRPQFRGST